MDHSMYADRPSAPRDRSRIDQVLDDLSGAITNLTDRCGELESRLEPVTRMRQEKVAMDSQLLAPSPTTPQLADRIMDRSCAISRCVEQLQSIIERLEL